MKTQIQVFALLCMPLVAASAATIEYDLTTALGNGSIGPYPGGQDWTSEQIAFPRNSLRGGDLLVLNIDFDRRLLVRDTWFNENESIYFYIGGSGGVGGGLQHDLAYTWRFSGVEGSLSQNPVNGTGDLFGSTGNGFIDTTFGQHRELELTSSSFSFADIELSITVPNTIGAEWEPNFVRVGVDGDYVIIVPEPSQVLSSGLLLLGIGFAYAVSCKVRRARCSR